MLVKKLDYGSIPPKRFPNSNPFFLNKLKRYWIVLHVPHEDNSILRAIYFKMTVRIVKRTPKFSTEDWILYDVACLSHEDSSYFESISPTIEYVEISDDEVKKITKNYSLPF